MADRTLDPAPRRDDDTLETRNPSSSSAMVHPACGAKTRAGAPCRALAMKNGRCRMHGGKSTGPKTAAGLERMRRAKTIHGSRGEHGRKLREMIRELNARTKRLTELS